MGCPGRMVILFDCDPLLLQLFFQSQVLLFLHTTPSSTWTALRAKNCPLIHLAAGDWASGCLELRTLIVGIPPLGGDSFRLG